MAIWIELRCDGAGRPRPSYATAGCATDQGESPGMLCRAHIDEVGHAYRELTQRAYRKGWQRTMIDLELKWLCPFCQGERPKTSD